MWVDQSDQASPNSNNYMHLPIISMQLNNFIRSPFCYKSLYYKMSVLIPNVCALSQILRYLFVGRLHLCAHPITWR